MRLVSIDKVNEDEVLGKTIFDLDGRRLVNAGVVLKPNIIQRLHEKGIYGVYIDDDFSEGIESDELLCEETRLHAKLIVRDEMRRLSNNKQMDYYRVSGVVDSIIDDILSKKVDLISVKDIRMQDENTFAHSVNVCVMSIALAVKLSIPVSKIKSIAMGALLHDIGKALLPKEITSKVGPLTESEAAEIKKHPIIGYNLIKDNSDTTATTKVSVLMHHEHINGNGYPMSLSGDKIHYSARIIAVCDEFDSMINSGKNENVKNTTDAIEYLIGTSGHIFDKSIVDEFMKIIPIYDTGSVVLLSNGIIGIVVKNNSVNLTRPVVRAIYNPKTGEKYINSLSLIDLRTELSIKIVRELDVNIKNIIDNGLRI